MKTTNPSGRHLAVPLVVALASGAAFAVLAIAVHAHAAPTSVDPEVAGDVLDLRSVWATHAAHALTLIGGEAVVGVCALLLLIAALERRGPRCALIVAASLTASAVLTVTVKLLLGRSRPGALDRLGPVDGSYSFPSGHTLNSAVLLGLVCLTVVPLITSPALRRVIVGACVALAAGIGASRVYLGYHWTTDVLASWLIAALLLSLTRVAMVLLDDAGHSDAGHSGASQVRGRRISA